MGCARYRDALSAQADGEDRGLDDRRLADHLAECPACRRYADNLADLGRQRRVTPAPTMPDLSRRVARRAAVQDRDAASTALRVLLAVVAVEVLVLSVSDLATGESGGTAAHATRHLGAFAAAYAIGLLAVAARPARARAMLPVAVVVAGALLVTAVVDGAQGRVPLAGEALHVPEIVSVVVIWLLARPRRARAPRSDGGLAVVTDEPTG